MKNYVAFIFLTIVLFTSCSLYNKTTYRHSPKEEYYKECGFELLCEYDINDIFPKGEIVVTVIRPHSLNGIKCDNILTAKSVKVKFLNPSGTLSLSEVYKGNEFIFTSPNLKQLVHENKTIEIRILFNGEQNERVFTFTRHKHLRLIGWKMVC